MMCCSRTCNIRSQPRRGFLPFLFLQVFCQWKRVRVFLLLPNLPLSPALWSYKRKNSCLWSLNIQKGCSSSSGYIYTKAISQLMETAPPHALAPAQSPWPLPAYPQPSCNFWWWSDKRCKKKTQREARSNNQVVAFVYKRTNFRIHFGFQVRFEKGMSSVPFDRWYGHPKQWTIQVWNIAFPLELACVWDVCYFWALLFSLLALHQR